MAKQRGKASVARRPRLAVCRGGLAAGLVLAVMYAVLMMSITVWGWRGLGQGALVVWGVAQAVLAYGVFCLYRRQRAARWGAVAAVLAMSAVFTFVPPSPFLGAAFQALALAGFSLVLYDLQKVLGVPLMLPGGLIFLSVIASLLNSPLMAFVGLAFLALGSALALTRL